MYTYVHIWPLSKASNPRMNEAYPVALETTSIPPVTPPKLLDQVRGILRAKRYSYPTEQAYVHWIRRFILFHGKRHPREMGTVQRHPHRARVIGA